MTMKTLYNYIGAGLMALSCTALLSCTEIEDGVNDIDTWEDVEDYTTNLQHPCMLHTQADFDFVKEKVANNESPWIEAYNHLTQSSYAQSSYTAEPVVKLARLNPEVWRDDMNRWEEAGITEYYDACIGSGAGNFTSLMRDAAAAYQLALRWKILGEAAYAATAVKILNDWAATCTGYLVNTQGELIDTNQYLIAMQIHQLANAAEILRDYDGWSEADFTKYKNWMVDVFYPQATDFLNLHAGQTDCPLHYWLNWDLAEMTAILSIGILTDDNFKINEAIQYFKFGVGGGNIINAVPFMHQDPDSGEMLGQCMESGRDQGHATLCVSLMAAFCQMAKNVGEDLFIFDGNMALAMCEYVAKYNLGDEIPNSSSGWEMNNFRYNGSQIPFSTYQNCAGISHTTISDDGRGTVRPAWELVKRLASDYGQTSIYADMWVETMRQNASRGHCDGGAGDYGPNSGGFDQLGYGTLMFAKE